MGPLGDNAPPAKRILAGLLLPRPGFPDRYPVKSVIGPDEDSKPVLTLIQFGEDSVPFPLPYSST